MSTVGKWCFAIFLVVAGNLFADTAKPLELLQQARERLNSQNYKASYEGTDSVAGGNEKNIRYHRVMPDGTVYERREIFHNGLLSLVEITNEDGIFHVIGNKAIKLEYRRGVKNILDGIEQRAGYRQKDGELENIECIVIVQENPMDDVAYSAYVNSIPKDVQRRVGQKGLQQGFKVKFPAKREYFIDKKTGLLCGTKSYDRNGKLISSNIYNKLELNPELPDSLFRIPAGITVEVAGKQTEYAQQSIKALDTRRVEEPERMAIRSKEISKPFPFLFSLQGQLFIWGGIGLLVSGVFGLVRNRKQKSKGVKK